MKRVLVLFIVAACGDNLSGLPDVGSLPTCESLGCANPTLTLRLCAGAGECTCATTKDQAPVPCAPRCSQLPCTGLACGNLTPEGDLDPTACTCAIRDTYVPCHTAVAPRVRLVMTEGDEALAIYRDAARAWTDLGFDVDWGERGDMLECRRRWYDAPGVQAIDCQITVTLNLLPDLLTHDGVTALSVIADRSVAIDVSLRGPELRVAVAHELGHILLDTPEHTTGGVMGGSTWALTAVDRDLACRTIGICQ